MGMTQKKRWMLPTTLTMTATAQVSSWEDPDVMELVKEGINILKFAHLNNQQQLFPTMTQHNDSASSSDAVDQLLQRAEDSDG